MTTEDMRQSLAEAIAPADEYEIPEDLPLPKDPPPVPPEGECHYSEFEHDDTNTPTAMTYSCHDPATVWIQERADADSSHGQTYGWGQRCERHAKPRFEVRNDRMATWALRKYREVLIELGQAESAIEETYAVERARIDAWKEAVLKEQPLTRARRSKEFFEAHLARYMEHIRRVSNGARKSLKLPSGTLSSTASQRVEFDGDGSEYVQWAIENDRLDLLKVEPVVGALKKLLRTDKDGALLPEIVDVVQGEIISVPGIRIVPNISYTVKPS